MPSKEEARNNKFYCGETVKDIFMAEHGIEIRRNFVTWGFYEISCQVYGMLLSTTT